MQFTCWGADGANESGKGIDKISSNIWQVLNAHAYAEVLRSVGRPGVFQIEKPVG